MSISLLQAKPIGLKLEPFHPHVLSNLHDFLLENKRKIFSPFFLSVQSVMFWWCKDEVKSGIFDLIDLNHFDIGERSATAGADQHNQAISNHWMDLPTSMSGGYSMHYILCKMKM